MKRIAILGLALVLGLAACGHPTGQAQAAADSTTKAVYNDDANAVTQNFDDTLKTQVTRSEVGILSDQMHKYGDYKGLTYVSTDPAKNEYTYRANFTKGSMNVVVKLDADGKVAAYRVFAPVAAIQSP
jgi:outer membrane lipopolysaccharide assembly protein LptE/RlpB